MSTVRPLETLVVGTTPERPMTGHSQDVIGNANRPNVPDYPWDQE